MRVKGGKRGTNDRRTCPPFNVAFLISLPIAVLLLYDVAIVRGYIERELAEKTLWANLRLNPSSAKQAAMPSLGRKSRTARNSKFISVHTVGVQGDVTALHRHQGRMAVEEVTSSHSVLQPSPPRIDGVENKENLSPATASNDYQTMPLYIEDKSQSEGNENVINEKQNQTTEALVIPVGDVAQEQRANETKVRDATEYNDDTRLFSSIHVEEAQVKMRERLNDKHDDESTNSNEDTTTQTQNSRVVVPTVTDNRTTKIATEKIEVSTDRTTSNNNVKPVAQVLMVVLAIPDGYPLRADIASRSHEAYAKRHGYRLVVQRDYLGNSTYGKNYPTISMQKLLACQLLQQEEYVLVVDYDVVIAPWSPPIHESMSQINGKVGIVDESQPSLSLVTKVLHYRTGRTRIPSEYYRSMGFTVSPSNGLLNTGMLVFHRQHASWFESLYYEHVQRVSSLNSNVSFHYEQALIGAELMRRDLVGLLPHAWNRNWMWYNYTHLVGGERYELGDMFRRSYFMHFLWAKNDMPKLDQWMRSNNITFEPVPYATELLP